MKKDSVSTLKSFRDIGLYTSYDISMWCALHGMESVYIERRARQLMSISFTVMFPTCWAVMDARQPGKTLQKFVLQHEEKIMDVRSRAEAWVYTMYGVPMTYVPYLSTCFSTVALDVIADEIADTWKVWNPSAPATSREKVIQQLLQEV